jgi:hypothetical protein
MKTVILILISFACSAQVSLPVHINSLSEVKKLIAPTVSGYSLERADTAVADFKRVWLQYGTEQNGVNARFFKTDSHYEFNQLTGSFDTLLLFWKKYVQPNANVEQIKSSEQEVVLWEKKRLVFYKSGNEWVIVART